MDLSQQLLKEMLGSYLQTTFSQILPGLIKESLRDNDLLVGQDFLSLEEAGRRYNLCRKTLYKSHIRMNLLRRSGFLFYHERRSHKVGADSSRYLEMAHNASVGYCVAFAGIRLSLSYCGKKYIIDIV